MRVRERQTNRKTEVRGRYTDRQAVRQTDREKKERVCWREKLNLSDQGESLFFGGDYSKKPKHPCTRNEHV